MDDQVCIHMLCCHFIYTTAKRHKMHTLFRTTPSILLPCLGQRTKCVPSHFNLSHLQAIAIEQIHVVQVMALSSQKWCYINSCIIIVLLLYLEYKQNSSSKSNQSCSWQYPVDRLKQNCVPCLGQTHRKLYTLFRTER